MARTPSVMVALGTKLPSFQLPDVVSGKNVDSHLHVGKHGSLVMFICNHCPFVKHIQEELVRLGNDYIKQGISLVAINSNDVESYPDDSPEKMKELALKEKYPFPYLFDASQDVARSFDAACTPDFFLFNRSNELVYRGQLDDSRPGNGVVVTGKDLRAAMDQVLLGKAPDSRQHPSLGCNIKWRKSL